MHDRERIYGSILGAAVGDAMGAATETKNTAMIQSEFGGYVSELLTPPADTFAAGARAGSVTDDFSLAYFTALELAECGGRVDRALAERALLRWAEHPEFYRYAGPTTRASVDRLRGLEVPEPPIRLACDNGSATNGSAMKIFPVGLIHPGDLEGAIRDTVVICLPTHRADASISGAAAIACAVSCAVTGASLGEVIEAGIYGARRGLEEGRRAGRQTAVASVERRIGLAVEIGRRGVSWEERMRDLAELIGSGIAVNEAVPCVFGILAATGGELAEAVRMGVNIGNDTDTVASMCGAIAGAMTGQGGLPAVFADTIESVNHMDLRRLADRLCEEYYAGRREDGAR